MQSFLRAAVVGAALLAVSGCGKNSAVQAAEAYEQEACKCTDKKCAEQALRKFIEATEGKPATASSSEAETFSKAKAKAVSCASGLPEVSTAPTTGSAASAAGPSNKTK